MHGVRILSLFIHLGKNTVVLEVVRMYILFLLGLFLGIPLIVTFVIGKWVVKNFYRTINEIKNGPFEEEKYHGKDRESMGLMIILFLLSIVYGIALVCIVLYFAPNPLQYQERVIRACGYIMATSSIVGTVGQGIVLLKAVTIFPWDLKKQKFLNGKGIQKKNCRTKKKKTFYRYFILAFIPHIVIVISFIFSQHLLEYSGMSESTKDQIHDEYWETENDHNSFIINETNVDEVEKAGLVFTILSIPSVLSGVLPSYIKGKISDNSVFKRKLVLACLGLSPVIIGILSAWYMIYN